MLDNAKASSFAGKVKAYFGEYAPRVLSLYSAGTNEQAKESWEEIYSVIYFNYGHFCLTRQALANGIPVYAYHFTKDNGRLGANHGGEEVYFYNNIPAGSKHYDESDAALSAVMSDYFMNFLTCGDPNGPGLPRWDKAGRGKCALRIAPEGTAMGRPDYLQMTRHFLTKGEPKA